MLGTYFTFQRERKSETIMLLSNCAELLVALFLKKSITYFINARSFYLDLVQNQPLAGQQRSTLIFMSLVIGLQYHSEKISSVFSSWSRALFHVCTYFGFIPSSVINNITFFGSRWGVRACPFYLSLSEKLLPHLSFTSSMGCWVPLDSSVHLVSELPRRSWILQVQKKYYAIFRSIRNTPKSLIKIV